MLSKMYYSYFKAEIVPLQRCWSHSQSDITLIEHQYQHYGISCKDHYNRITQTMQITHLHNLALPFNNSP